MHMRFYLTKLLTSDPHTHTRSHGYGIFNARSYSTSFCTLHAPLPPHRPTTPAAFPAATSAPVAPKTFPAQTETTTAMAVWEQQKPNSNFYRLIHPDTFHAPDFSCSFSCPALFFFFFNNSCPPWLGISRKVFASQLAAEKESNLELKLLEIGLGKGAQLAGKLQETFPCLAALALLCR